MKHLGKILHAWRITSELTLRSVAESMGIGVTTLCRVERGEMPDAKTLKRIICWLLEESHVD